MCPEGPAIKAVMILLNLLSPALAWTHSCEEVCEVWVWGEKATWCHQLEQHKGFFTLERERLCVIILNKSF